MKQVIIHVGFHKTATTSIQETCTKNKHQLEEQGFYYPIFNLDHRVITNHSIPFYSLFSSEPEKYHINVRWGIDPQEANQKYESQLNQIFQQKPEKIIISGEDISELSQVELERMKSKIQSYGYDIRVIAVVRSPLSAINSMIMETVKNGYTIADLNLSSNTDKSKIITKIEIVESVFPEVEFFAFRDFLNHKYGPVGSFLEIIGVPDFSGWEFFRANASISDQATRLISFINQEQPLFLKGKINILRSNQDTTAIHLLPGSKFRLHGHELKPLRAGVKQVNQYLLDKFNLSFCDEDSYLSLNDPENNWSDEQIEQLKIIISQVNNNIKIIAYDYFKNIICLDKEKLAYIFFQENQKSADLDTPIYRFQNSRIPGTYLFVTEEEAHYIRTNFPDFIEECVAFNAAITPNDNLIPLYRFQSNQHPGLYLYVGEVERNQIHSDSNLASAFNDEGIAFYVYAAGAGFGTPFYRFQNPDIPGAYLYATGSEADIIRAHAHNFIDQGIAFEATI